MDNRIVVGIGNIYATEALFAAGIHPQKPANTLTHQHAKELAKQIKHILRKAISQGGTTLKDFTNADGKPGYFKQALQVYGREGLACKICGTSLASIYQNQRKSVFCPKCQR